MARITWNSEWNDWEARDGSGRFIGCDHDRLHLVRYLRSKGFDRILG